MPRSNTQPYLQQILLYNLLLVLTQLLKNPNAFLALAVALVNVLCQTECHELAKRVARVLLERGDADDGDYVDPGFDRRVEEQRVEGVEHEVGAFDVNFKGTLPVFWVRVGDRR